MRNYRRLLAIPAVRTVYLVGFLTRVPLFGSNILLTLHIVDNLTPSYSLAGIVTAVYTVATAVAQPWRGRLLDRVGLRRTLVPSLIALPVLWVVACFVPYWPLLLVIIPTGVLSVPTFSILRQAVITAAPGDLRRTALSLDSVFVELGFMVGPVLAVIAATGWGSRWALLAFALASVLGYLGLWAMNPATSEPAAADAAAPVGHWVTAAALGALGIMGAATLILSGTDVSIVAALRNMGRPGDIGWVMALWAAGSAVAGLVYGGLHRPIHPAILLAGLALGTLPGALAHSPLALALLLLVGGMFCAPTIASSVDYLTHAVRPDRRGEAMGWHGALGTAGSALGAPGMGIMIDAAGWRAGMVTAGCVGVALALAGGSLLALRRRRARSVA